MANDEIEVRKENSPASMLDVVPEFDRAFDNMIDRFFGTRLNSRLGDWPEASRRAITNIQETNKSYILSAEIPGIPKEDVKIDINGNLLTVQAEHSEETGSETSKRGRQSQYRSFYESFSLPTNIEADKIEAHYQDGVLEIMLPKNEQAQPKKVEIQSGKGGFLNRMLGKSEQRESSQQKAESKH